ncbi:hypothetical protein [Anthocerotibacter panamensis]|uniref:hypothetical protein n=1 Tax=Anthocerotibacter panamensis TaxID=2857077 RepID=UPI001C405F9B|nr:hypothetical protein [Anthocerotibacter panamensis]
MDLEEALARVCEDQRYQAKSPLEAIKALNEEVTEALIAWLRGNQTRSREEITEALPRLLVAMRLLGIDPVAVLRQKALQVAQRQRMMCIVGNRVEVRVGEELRGSWTIWSEEDLREVHRLAEEFDCQLVHLDEEPNGEGGSYYYGSGSTSPKVPR